MTETCTKCGIAERVPGQRLCKPCRQTYDAARKHPGSNADAGSNAVPAKRREVKRAGNTGAVVRGAALATTCVACAHRWAAIRAAFVEFVREADPGLLARLRWAAFYGRVLDALEGG